MKHKLYASLITAGCWTGKPTIACGSFEHLEIDARLSIHNAIAVAANHFKNRPGNVGFVLYKGSIREAKTYSAHCKWDEFGHLISNYTVPQKIKDLL